MLCTHLTLSRGTSEMLEIQLEIYTVKLTGSTITWIPSGFSGYIWLDTKIVLKKIAGIWKLENQFTMFC